MTKRTSGRQQDIKKSFKNLKAGYRREGRKLRKGKVKQEQRQNNARPRRGCFKTNIRRRGPGLSGALCSLYEGGEEEQGSEGLLEASHAGKGAGKGKQNCGWVKGRLR